MYSLCFQTQYMYNYGTASIKDLHSDINNGLLLSVDRLQNTYFCLETLTSVPLNATLIHGEDLSSLRENMLVSQARPNQLQHGSLFPCMILKVICAELGHSDTNLCHYLRPDHYSTHGAKFQNNFFFFFFFFLF